MIGLILAAGEGKRLNNDMPEKTAKPLVNINQKYLIEYSLQNCVDAGIKTVIIVVNSDNKNSIASSIGSEYNGMNIFYAVQKSPIGLLNAALSASEYLNDCVMLQLSDEIFINPKIKECVKLYADGADFVVTFVYENNKEKIRNNFSIDLDGNRNVIHCVEKPKKIINDLKGTGLCIFSRECMDLLKKLYNQSENYPDNLCDAFNLLVESRKSGKAFCISEEEININTVSELEYAQTITRDEII